MVCGPVDCCFFICVKYCCVVYCEFSIPVEQRVGCFFLNFCHRLISSSGSVEHLFEYRCC